MKNSVVALGATLALWSADLSLAEGRQRPPARAKAEKPKVLRAGDVIQTPAGDIIRVVNKRISALYVNYEGQEICVWVQTYKRIPEGAKLIKLPGHMDREPDCYRLVKQPEK